MYSERQLAELTKRSEERRKERIHSAITLIVSALLITGVVMFIEALIEGGV